jgi:hypothetical protein
MEEIVTLASIGNGAALELFEHELKRVIANIADPNTSAKTKRGINIKVVIQPDEDRGIGFAQVEVTSKLAGVKPVQSTMYFGKKDGEFVAVQNNIAQPGIFDTEKSNVTPLAAVDRKAASANDR